MNTIIDRINAEARSYRYPNYKPFFELKEAKKKTHIEALKNYIKEVDDPEEKGEIYGILGFVGWITKQDQASYILGELEKERHKKTIAAALVSMTAIQVPILDNSERLLAYLKEKNSALRHAAISATELCIEELPKVEQKLIEHYEITSNRWDKFWIVVTFESIGSKACLDILRKAMDDVKDGVNYILFAANRIEPTAMTSLYIEVINSRKNSFTKGLAMKGLYLGKDFSALDAVLERAKKILKKKTTTPNIDHLDGCSEIQSAIMYLQLFEEKDDRIPAFFSWIKEKRFHYMDDQTQDWATKNL